MTALDSPMVPCVGGCWCPPQSAPGKKARMPSGGSRLGPIPVFAHRCRDFPPFVSCCSNFQGLFPRRSGSNCEHRLLGASALCMPPPLGPRVDTHDGEPEATRSHLSAQSETICPPMGWFSRPARDGPWPKQPQPARFRESKHRGKTTAGRAISRARPPRERGRPRRTWELLRVPGRRGKFFGTTLTRNAPWRKEGSKTQVYEMRLLSDGAYG
jgi:hypothetical protein